MPITTIVFGILLSTFCGAIYHLIRGGTTKKIWFYLILAWAGFWLGDTLGYYLGWSLVPVGLLNAGTGVIFSFIFLGLGDLLSGMVIRARE